MKTLVCCIVFASALAGCAQPGPPRHPGMQAAKDGAAGSECASHMKDMKAGHERMPMHAAAGASAPQDHGQTPAQGAGGMMAMQGECKMMPKP
jgi:hypothetical protein